MSCYFNRAESVIPKIVIIRVSVDTVFLKRVLSPGQTKIYPARPTYYNVNEYLIRIEAYESSDMFLQNIDFTVLCYFADNSIRRIRIRAEDIIRLSDHKLSLTFPLEIKRSGFVGFSIATREELVQMDQLSYRAYLKSNQEIFLGATEP